MKEIKQFTELEQFSVQLNNLWLQACSLPAILVKVKILIPIIFLVKISLIRFICSLEN